MADLIRIGTRGSLLAKTQASAIKDALVAKGHPAELVIIATEGDRSSDVRSPRSASASSPRRCARPSHDGRVDIAVHSYKDLPTAEDPRFTIAAIPPREDARDALVARDGLVLGELPVGFGDRHLEPATGRAA